MEMNFVKVHVDALEAYKRLSDAEFGRALRAVLQYLRDGTEEDLSGKDSIMYDVLRQQVERDRASYEKRLATQRENGSKGGRPKGKPKETQTNPWVSEKPKQTHGFFENPKEPKQTQKTQEKEKEKEIPPYSPPTGDEGGGGFLTAAAAGALAEELDSVLDAARAAGFPETERMREELNRLCADFTAGWVLAAIEQAVDSAHGVPSKALLRAILDRFRRDGGPDGQQKPKARGDPNDGYAYQLPADFDWSKAELD